MKYKYIFESKKIFYLPFLFVLTLITIIFLEIIKIILYIKNAFKPLYCIS